MSLSGKRESGFFQNVYFSKFFLFEAYGDTRLLQRLPRQRTPGARIYPYEYRVGDQR